MKSFTLRGYWAIVFALFIGIFTLFISIIVARVTIGEIKKEKGESIANIAFQMKDSLDLYMYSRQSEIKIFSQLETLQSTESTSNKRQLLDNIQGQMPAFSWMGITDEAGIVQVATDGLLEGSNISERPVFQEARTGLFIGDVHEALLLADLLPNPTKEKIEFIDISMPLYDETGAFSGVLAAHLSWEWALEVQKMILHPLAEKANSLEVFVLSPSDNRVLLGPKSFVGHSLSIDNLQLQKATAKHSGWQLTKWDGGQYYLTGYAEGPSNRDYPGLSWTVLVREPEETAFAAAERVTFYTLLIGTISALIFAVVGWFIAGKVSRPLQAISSSAKQFRKGQVLQLPVATGIKEIEELSDSLQGLVQNLGKMEGLAHQDALTGLANRFALEKSAARLFQETLDYHATLSCFYMDLDGFKEVNDGNGHQAGDVVLMQVAEILREEFPEKAIVSRIGGDEFLILLPNESNPHLEGNALFSTILSRINSSVLVDGQQAFVGCSVGVSVFPDDETDLYTLISYADQALYEAKHKGKNQLVFYGNSTTSRVPRVNPATLPTS